jgi:hypothetical protein
VGAAFIEAFLEAIALADFSEPMTARMTPAAGGLRQRVC